ncbi:MAG: MnhB domain-containing protein [Actinomycetota bacterium]|nr:MnhB domain-containing protein [Actinomycetota bacterium]
MMRRSLIFDVSIDTVFRMSLVFSIFMFFAGHNAPGGGFIGGLVAGAALVLRYLAGGSDGSQQVGARFAHVMLGTGLMIAVATGFGGWVWGTEFLENTGVGAELPLLGTVKATTSLLFDAGVYLVVVGLVMEALGSLGHEVER